MIKNKSVKNSLIYISSDILNKAIPFLLLHVITKYLSSADYGIVTVFISLTALLTVFIGLSTQNAIYVNYFTYSKEKMQVYISNIILLIILSTVSVLLFMMVFQTYISDIIAIPTIWLFFAILYIFTQTLSSILTILWMVESKAIFIGIFQIANTILLFVLALVLIVQFDLTWVGYMSAMLVSSSIFAMISLYILIKNDYLRYKIDKESLIDALKFGIPLIPHQLGEWVKLSSDKFLLVAMIGPSATGLYAVGYQITSMIMIVAVSIQKAWQPYLFKRLSNISREDEKISIVKMTYVIIGVIVLMSLVLYLISPFIIDIFLDKSFQETKYFIGYLTLTNMFAAMSHAIIGYIYYAKKTKVLVKITFISAVIHVCISYILILANGPIGAAQASSISFCITLVLIWNKSNQVYPMPWLLSYSSNRR